MIAINIAAPDGYETPRNPPLSPDNMINLWPRFLISSFERRTVYRDPFIETFRELSNDEVGVGFSAKSLDIILPS